MSERPDTAALLDEVEAFIRRFVVLPGELYYAVIALWVLHTHAIAAFDTTPRLIAKSAEKESGKSRLVIEVLGGLVYKPLSFMNATVAGIFRVLAEGTRTLLVDEADTIFSPKASTTQEEIRGLLNAGYRKGACVLRAVLEGKKVRAVEFPAFAAVALTCIGDLPSTIESRGIPVPMRRRRPDEPVEQFRINRPETDAELLCAALTEWGGVYEPLLSAADPRMPVEVTDRAADIWAPLLAIADLAEGDWPARAREAAVAIVTNRVAEDQSIGVRLLSDIKVVLNGDDRMSSAALAGALNSLEESSWASWNAGRGLTVYDLARRLKPYGVASKTIRVGTETPRGYEVSQFRDPFSRYLRDTQPVVHPKAEIAPRDLLDDVLELD